MLALLIAAALAQQPGRDPALLHRHVEQVVAEKEREQEQSLRRLLELGGTPREQAEVLARLAGLLRARGLALAILAQSEADSGDETAAARDRTHAADARSEAIARYRELLKKYPNAGRTDEALFFLADTLQDSGRDQEAVQSARELTRRFPRSQWAPASHVFIGEHLFDAARLDEALKEYRAAAEVPSDEVYPYAIYKAAWCRFNQSAFVDAMKLLKRVVDVSTKAGDVNTVQLAREARRDYVLAYGRIGDPEGAHADFARKFGAGPALTMLEQYGKLLFDTGRDPEAQSIARQLLALHGDAPAAALDQTRLLVIAQRTGKRKDLLTQAKLLVDTFQRVRKDPAGAGRGALEDEKYAEANQLGEETLRNLAVQIHNEARKTDLDETWAAARALYSDYLTLFPDAPDAYDLRFFFGELLYTRDLKSAAAEQYEAVVRRDLGSKEEPATGGARRAEHAAEEPALPATGGARRAEHAKAPGKWLQKAAWSAVLSRNEAVFGAQKESKDTGERRAQRALTPEEQKLAAACRLYLQALPGGPHAVEVAFKVGRLEYISGELDAAQKDLAAIALQHPEHELAEYAANLVLDIANLRKDWPALHGWALKFVGDKRLTAHGTLSQDLKRIEEQSAYALADAATPDARKSEALLSFVAAHPNGVLADKALFGAAAALSRAGRIDDALAARARVWKEQPQSPLVPRALVASAQDLSAVGDLGEAAGLLEKYAQGYQKQEALKKWRREHPSKTPKTLGPVYEEARAQSGLHDAALLREARGELKQAVQDRSLSLQLWKNAADREEARFALSQLRARLGETARAARELSSLAREAKGKPSLQLRAWHEAARLFAKAHETGNSLWSWTEVELVYKALGPKAREKLPSEAVAAAAGAHFALGGAGFDHFRKEQIKAPLMTTLNRKIALLQAVKKRAEETVAMRQAEPAVCALARLGEAQMLLGQALAQSPFPPGLNAEQRKLYRAALAEKAQPIFADARNTLSSADGKALELGVTGACAARVEALLEKLNAKPAARPQLPFAPAPAVAAPEMMDAREVASERAKRLLAEALAANGKLPAEQSVVKFQAAAEAEGAPGPALFDLAIALDQAGRASEAQKAYRSAAQVKGALGYDAAARLAALSASRGDAQAAREALSLAEAAYPGPAARVLRAQIELALGQPEAAQAAARMVLAQSPADAGALCAMARAQLAQGRAGVAKLLASRVEQADPHDAEPILIKMEAARATHQPAEELAAARAAAEADPESPQAALALGRVLFEHGQPGEAVDQLDAAVELDPASYPARLAQGEALAASADRQQAEEALTQAIALAPKAAEPHLALARLKLDGDGDAQAALAEAKLFLTLSTPPPPPGHPIHALVQRCEEALKQRAQASVVH
jgi:tetratricopeptide (TPR) repeat protein